MLSRTAKDTYSMRQQDMIIPYSKTILFYILMPKIYQFLVNLDYVTYSKAHSLHSLYNHG